MDNGAGTCVSSHGCTHSDQSKGSCWALGTPGPTLGGAPGVLRGRRSCSRRYCTVRVGLLGLAVTSWFVTISSVVRLERNLWVSESTQWERG